MSMKRVEEIVTLDFPALSRNLSKFTSLTLMKESWNCIQALVGHSRDPGTDIQSPRKYLLTSAITLHPVFLNLYHRDLS